ncbi:LOG family protein [Larkinella rosea]|uniref:Cytokinin riboside 5'-monophosphate phosphoribohydrolase n=1 Tax=Larkinella rosea TaxID=2025312 RepID=A0A3P1BCS5_9BACT|nr:TIGR00730 family Rossman fold protein [Larkinella rosea]RRA98572.1 TIGR00730 family Rossman fold protein [Larkinella rosea]
MKSIVVYCGSNPGTNPLYQKVAEELGQKFAEKEIRLIYGGGNIGLMRAVADGVLQNGGQVTGVITNFLAELEVAHETLTELHFVETMHERKFKMVQFAKGVIALPGGYGTFDELFEILTWRQLQLYNGPVAVLNVNGFYDLLLLQLDRMVADGFLKAENRELLIVSETIEDIMLKIEEFWEQAI